MVHLDATLGEQLFEVPVGQPEAEVPAHRQQDHLGRETEANEPRGHPHRRSRTASALHRATLTATVSSVNATEPSQVQVAEAGGLQGGDVPLAGVLLGVDVPGHGQPAADFFDGSEPVLVAPRVEAVEKVRGVLDAVA